MGHSRSDQAVSLVLVLCALATTAIVVRRELRPSPGPSPGPLQATKHIRSWKALAATGRRIGLADAPLQLIEFGDFECPACAGFHRQLAAESFKHKADIAIHYVHYPLPYHRFATPAAKAAECAADQGRFNEMHQLLFAHQDSLGLKPWASFAASALVDDTVRFNHCLDADPPKARVDAQRALGDSLGITGTPTFIANGWLLSRVPTLTELDSLIREVAGGRDIGSLLRHD